MEWSSVAQYIELCLGFVLATRLLLLKLHRVYKYFAIFLLVDVSSNLIWAIEKRTGTPFHVDYRVVWLIESVAMWVFTLLTVYALMDAILAHLPGILRLSRKVLNISFSAAIIIGIASAVQEFRNAVSAEASFGSLVHIVAWAIVFDRVIDSAALLTLLCILIFLIWFPVEMSRNLVLFFSGFVIYFALRTCITLSLTLGLNDTASFLQFVNMLNAGLAATVFAYWSFSITRAGEKVPAKLPVPSFTRKHEALLLSQLEAMNASLLSAVRKAS
ncbi:MAG TPA: hypothetical protein VH302_08825 [Bryobacteraceae bacterium]|jgi:hypothetical protein|nr:hypothetical protein [Bryobacteraceae bacterium]